MNSSDYTTPNRLGRGLRKIGLLVRATWAMLPMLLALSNPMWAATMIVDETNCTLVDAITAANTDSPIGGCPAGFGPDTIELTTDVMLTEVNNGDNVLPVIQTDVTIEGAGFAIRAWYPFYCSRFFLVLENATLRLNNTTLAPGGGAGGSAEQSEALVPGGPCALEGGGILNLGSLTLTNTMVLGNPGGGIISGQGSVILTGCTLQGNAGAGIDSSGTASLTNTVVADNFGTGIRSSGILSVTYSTVSGNERGVYVDGGELSMASSTLSENHVGGAGIGAQNYPGYGGGILCSGASCSIVNSTLSGNVAGGCSEPDDVKGGPSICGEGGAVYGSGEAFIVIVNSTLFANYSEWGGPIRWSGSTSPPSLGNSIVAGNIVGGFGSPCPGAIDDLGNNLSDDDCGPVFAVITGLDPELVDNGGPTLTHALLPGSSAIDAAGDCGLATDQRGLLRWDGTCDTGGFEYGATADLDQDGVLDEEDLCPGTEIPESVPTHHLGVNRWALVDGDSTFDTTPPPGGGGGPDFAFATDDTRGCSCEQIIEALALGWGHTKFGCSTGAM